MEKRRATREEIFQCLGHIPEPGQLDPEIITRKYNKDYVLEIIEHAASGNDRVKSYMLIPNDSNNESYPGILAIHQHADKYEIGKSEPAGIQGEPDYAYGEELVKRGYAVICPDLICFGDRSRDSYRRVPSEPASKKMFERFVAMDRLLNGSSMQAKNLGDLQAAIDLLQWHNCVSSRKIGVIGHSLGGQNSLWLAWYDSRVSVAVSSCGACLYRSCQDKEITHNFSYYIPNLLTVGDIDDVLSSVPPTALFMTNGIGDPVLPVEGTRDLHQSVTKSYDRQGFDEKFHSVIFEGSHEFPKDIRENSYDWIGKWIDTHE